MLTPDQSLTDEYKTGKEYALRRLGRRECSAQDLRRKIIEKGVSAQTADLIIEELIRKSLVSDERFARILIRGQAIRSKGIRFIRQKLKEQGISLSNELISEISCEATACSEVETARIFVERKYPTFNQDKKTAARATQALLRRGFSYDVISAALSKVKS